MKQPTQHEKIITLCSDGDWHCQTQFWNISKSPHKRRAEITQDYGHVFHERPCEHGIKNSKDFSMNKKPVLRSQYVEREGRMVVVKEIILA